MKQTLITLLILVLFHQVATAQVQVKCDSVIKMYGQGAVLHGRTMKDNKPVVFVHTWRGMGKPNVFIGRWFTIHEFGIGRNKSRVTFNK